MGVEEGGLILSPKFKLLMHQLQIFIYKYSQKTIQNVSVTQHLFYKGLNNSQQ
jgi:hypothetical protein